MHQIRPFDYNRKRYSKFAANLIKDNFVFWKPTILLVVVKMIVRLNIGVYHPIFYLTPFTTILHYIKGVVIFW